MEALGKSESLSYEIFFFKLFLRQIPELELDSSLPRSPKFSGFTGLGVPADVA